MVATERLKKIVAVKAKSRIAFAKVVGVSSVAMDNYIGEKRRPSLDLIEKILQTYPDISAEWLLRGEGDMYRNAKTGYVNNYEINSHSTIHKGDVSDSYNNTSADLQQEVKTLKEKERLYLMQIAELKNDKTFLQNLLSKTS